ncbi:unnamed protein product [Spirodela intermedia]|uniref:Uncharacterized protein n=1 Tax=Spirodela intermedia TaxID=51605 RepID=A0A7I8IRH7_SPIIN|nr:unnamed protein product [Spirodela intermedia]CAA6660591.1 unnamed protein product [Spirodela intermedia]
MERKAKYGWAAAVVCFLVLMVVTPAIPQSQEYHQFADQRRLFLGIPNTLNVISNFPFLVVGIIGLILCEIWGWTCFFLGVAAVAFGSSYYHLDPDDATLVWDRLPMTIAFTSIVAIFIIERVNETTGTTSILPLVAAGAVSILYWRLFDDLRPYAVVQFVPCIAIPAMDVVVYRWTGHVISGHTLKHLSAAMVPVFLTLMLAKRSVEPDRTTTLLDKWRLSWVRVSERGFFKAERLDCEYAVVSGREG